MSDLTAQYISDQQLNPVRNSSVDIASDIGFCVVFDTTVGLKSIDFWQPTSKRCRSDIVIKILSYYILKSYRKRHKNRYRNRHWPQNFSLGNGTYSQIYFGGLHFCLSRELRCIWKLDAIICLKGSHPWVMFLFSVRTYIQKETEQLKNAALPSQCYEKQLEISDSMIDICQWKRIEDDSKCKIGTTSIQLRDKTIDRGPTSPQFKGERNQWNKHF